MNAIRAILIIALLCSLVGCNSSLSSRSPYLDDRPAHRSPLTAERLTLEAADLIAGEPKQAEQLLRQALAADLYHGPAHNNLGVLCLERGQLYEAAHEFEWARKLMPGHPDPRMNLALTLEHAGRIDDALETYATALEVYPDHLPTIQAMTRCQLRYRRTNEQTQVNLQQIALQGETELWRAWARAQLLELEGSPW
jgi:tetratricopeptide (TPR) repeat protein